MSKVYCQNCTHFDRDMQCCRLTCIVRHEGKERECDTFERRIVTNGDRIRAMSNEEIAEFLEENNCPPGMDSDARCPARCSICWLNWLNAEAKED